MQVQVKKIGFVTLSLLILAFYLNLDSLKTFFGRNMNIMGAEVLSLEEIEALCSGREEVFLYPDITLSDEGIAYDREQNMLLIPQSLWKENFQGKLLVPDGKLYFLEEEAFLDKAWAISQNQVFRLFWIRDRQYWMYNVYFTGMPVLNLTTVSQNEDESIGKVWVYDQYHDNGSCPETECTWHVRGASSRDYEKSGYRLTLTEGKPALLGMRRDDDWILNSLYDDDGLIHNKLSYEVWQKIAGSNHVSSDEGIRMEYVEVFVDEHYQGVYGLLERVDKKALSLNSRDILYKCCDDAPPGDDDFYTYLTEEMNPVFVMKYPSEFVMEDWEPLTRWISVFLEDEPGDYDFGRTLLNLENAIDYNLFNLLVCGMDNTMKNIYFWADYQQDGSYQFVKIPWDLNMTWGNSWIDDAACNFNRYQEKNLESTGGWTVDLYELYRHDPERIGQLMYERWQELRESIITKESLYGMAGMQYDYLYASGAYQRNGNKWPREGDWWMDEWIYEYIDKRIDFLDAYIGQMGQ